MRNKSERDKRERTDLDTEPKVYNVNRRKDTWAIDRRSFLTGTTSMTASALLAGTATLRSQDQQESIRPAIDEGECNSVQAHKNAVNTLAMYPGGRLLASGSMDNTIKVWSIPQGYLMVTLGEHSRSMGHNLEISANGRWLVSAGSDKKVMIWSLKDGELHKTFKASSSSLFNIAIAPNSKRFVTADWSGVIKVWKLKRGKLKKKWKIKGESFRCIAISPDGKLLATGGYKKIYVWSLSRKSLGELLHKLEGHETHIDALEFSPDGKWLVSGSSDNKLIIWSASNMKKKKTIQPHSTWGVGAIAIDPASKFIVSGGRMDYVKVWSLPDGKLIKTLAADKGSDWQHGASFAFTPDGKMLAIGYSFYNDRIRLWDPENWKLIRCFMDLDCNMFNIKGRTYQYRTSDGDQVMVTVPNCQCASIPEGAKCICDTVPGGLCGCQGHTCSPHHYWWPN